MYFTYSYTRCYPSSFDSLDPRDIALFEWIYSFDGENGDQAQFEAGLVNYAQTDTVLVTLQTVESSLNADIAVESWGLGDQEILGDHVLLMHSELADTNDYQLYSGAAESGANGLSISFTTPTPEPHFITKNQTDANRIPTGDWEFALMLTSEALPENVNDNPDMIFHFEEGSNMNAVNSQNDRSCNLEGCGIGTDSDDIDNAQNEDGHEHTNNDDTHTNGDHDLGNERIIGVRFNNMDIDEDEQINSAYIELKSQNWYNNNLHLRIYGELPADGDADPIIHNQDRNLSSRDRTSAYVDWIINGDIWTNNQVVQTPDLSSIISEITSQTAYDNGDDIMIMFFDHPTTSTGNSRTVDSSDDGPPRLVVNHGAGNFPQWGSDFGPHGSGAHMYDGVNDCFKSINTVSSGNNLGSGSSTSSFWFRTTDNDANITEDMYLLHFQDEGYSLPSGDTYSVYLTQDVSGTDGGKVEFTINHSASSGEATTCTTVNEYDNNQWHHVTIKRDSNSSGDDECYLTITNLDGTNPESSIYASSDGSGSSIDVYGHWHIGSNQDEDGNFFKGYIDDVIHWDAAELEQFEMDDIARTNYGDGAHQFSVTVQKTDEEGNNPTNIIGPTTLNTAFADPMTYATDYNDDSRYKQINMTLSGMPEVNLASGERLEVFFSWVSPTATWEALETTMKLDDTDIAGNVGGTPHPSFLQIPPPNLPFPTYYEYNPNDEFQIFIANTGNDGIFLTYGGTRISFNRTEGSYAGLIHSANGSGTSGDPSCATHCWWNMDHDSLHVPKGEIVKLYFHESTDIPSNDESGNLMVDGKYDATVWSNGYSDQGETFLRSVYIGVIDVVTP